MLYKSLKLRKREERKRERQPGEYIFRQTEKEIRGITERAFFIYMIFVLQCKMYLFVWYVTNRKI